MLVRVLERQLLWHLQMPFQRCLMVLAPMKLEHAMVKMQQGDGCAALSMLREAQPNLRDEGQRAECRRSIEICKGRVG